MQIPDAVAVSPPVIVTGVTIAGMELEAIVLWATLVYTIIMIVKNVIPTCKAVRKLYVTAKQRLLGDRHD